MIKLLRDGKRIINVDETWINLKNYRRRRWRQHGAVNSVNSRTISPRIPLIVAVSTEGELYFSLTQVNTDDEVKRLFLTELAAMLDLERPTWRKDTVVLMDNAGYNKTEDILTQIQRLKMPVLFSAPYSYDAAPVERFFGYFKQGRVMPEEDSSGKK